LIGIAFCFNIANILLQTGKVKENKFLSTSSFFVFAIHAPLLLVPVGVITRFLFRPVSDMAFVSLYFINVFCVVLLALLLYYLLIKYMSKFTSIITGGR